MKQSADGQQKKDIKGLGMAEAKKPVVKTMAAVDNSNLSSLTEEVSQKLKSAIDKL